MSEHLRRIERRWLSRWPLLVFGFGMATSAWVHAEERPESVVWQAQWLSDRGQKEQAQELLRRAQQAHPTSELIVLERASIYLADKNAFWALKVLGDFIAEQPKACASRALAARVHIQEGNLFQTERVLDAPECEQADEMRLRFLLLRTELAELRGDRERAKTYVLGGHDTRKRFDEDDARFQRLTRIYDPYRRPTFGFKVDLAAGWTSSGLATLPFDLAVANRGSGAPLLGLDLDTRWYMGSWGVVRPVFGAEVHLAQYLDSPERSLSSRRPIARLGLEMGRGPRRLFVGYASDWAVLEGADAFGDGATRYGWAHRAEYRFELTPSLLVYGNFGWQKFWQAERNRYETEQGVSKVLRISDTLQLSLGAGVRLHDANAAAYDLFGGTVRAGLEIEMPKGFELSESIALARDQYPHSVGAFADSDRGDNLVRIRLGLMSPAWDGLRLGAVYAYANRDSNANAFDYTDHRGLLTLTWQSDSDRLSVGRVAPDGRIPMPYPDDEGPNAAKSKVEVIEVIRQDEAQRQNSSCAR